MVYLFLKIRPLGGYISCKTFIQGIKQEATIKLLASLGSQPSLSLSLTWALGLNSLLRLLAGVESTDYVLPSFPQQLRQGITSYHRSCTNACHLRGARRGAWQQADTPSDKVKKIKSCCSYILPLRRTVVLFGIHENRLLSGSITWMSTKVLRCHHATPN